MHGKPIVAILACHSGRPAEGERLVAPIKTFGTPDRGRARAPSLRAAPGSARRHAAEGPPLLLEERVPAAHRAGAVRQGDRARGADRLAALGHHPVPDRRRLERGCRKITPRSATAMRATSSTSPAPGSQPARRCGEHRLGPGRWNDMQVVLHRRQVHQFPHRGRRPRAHRGGARRRARSGWRRSRRRWDPDNVFRTNRNIAPA